MLSIIKNTSSKWILISLLILIGSGMGVNTHAQENCRLLVWSDEFDYSGLPDSLKWGYDVGDGCDYGLCNWGNFEAQSYTYRDLDNARVENGNLVIEARKEITDNKKYSSARLVTRDVMELTYGRIEFRAKLAGGEGTWSALWILGDREALGWPLCGEIDVVEYVGAEPGIARGTVHQASGYGGGGPTMSIEVPDAETAFHTYAVEWNTDSIVWFVDDQKYHVYYNEHSGDTQWPYDNDFYLIMNLAIGGTLGGPINNDIFDAPVTMEIDYVRVYQTASEAGIHGKSTIAKNEANLTYSIPLSAEKYTWSVPEGVTVVSGEGTDSIVVDWGCDEGIIGLEIETTCDTSLLQLPVTFAPTVIEGRQAVYQGESSLVYSVPEITGGSYSWTVPDEAVITGGSDSREISLTWGCSEGTVAVNLEGSCLQETLSREIGLVPLEISGPGYVSAWSRDHAFSIDSLHLGSVEWHVPVGVTISGGDGTDRIIADWGSMAGYVVVDLENSCGLKKDSLYVDITSDLVIADFDVVNPEFLVFGGSNVETTFNPSKTDMNSSELAGMTYKDETAVSWGGFYTDLEEVMDFSSGSTFSMLSYAPRTGNVLFKIENSSGGVPALELSVPITNVNEWEELTFNFEDAANHSYNRVAIFFDFGQVFRDTFYFDHVVLLRTPESPGINLAQEEDIMEGSEDGKSIIVNLLGDHFVETLNKANWTFENLPEGVSIDSLNRVSNVRVDLLLNGNATADYDQDIENFTVRISPEELLQSAVELVQDTGIVFTANIENYVSNGLFDFVDVYPNPAGDILTVRSTSANGNQLQAELLDLNGKILDSFTLYPGSTFSLDLSSYPAGCYFLILEDEKSRDQFLIVHY